MRFRYKISGNVYQPKIPVVLAGPKGERRFNALVDTGSDLTILPVYDVAELTGVKINRRTRATVQGRSEAHREELFLGESCKLLLLGDDESYQWETNVWFSDDDASPPILGHVGFLEFFLAMFDGLKRELTLSPNKNFPGRVKKIKW